MWVKMQKYSLNAHIWAWKNGMGNHGWNLYGWISWKQYKERTHYWYRKDNRLILVRAEQFEEYFGKK